MVEVKLKKIKNFKQPAIWLGQDLISNIGLDVNQMINFSIGVKTFSLRVKQSPVFKEVGLDQETFEKIGLPENLSFILKNEQKALRLGPVLGICSEIWHDKYFAAQNEINGIIILFTFNNIDLENCRLTKAHYYYPPEESWQVTSCYLPDVIYDYSFHLTDSWHQKLTAAGVEHIFNSFGGPYHKLSVYKKIEKYAELKQFLPETRAFKSIGELIIMLNKYGSVFLKPVNLSRGRGIVEIEKISSNSYLAAYWTKSGNEKIAFADLELFIQKEGKKLLYSTQYLIQQKINLLQINQSKIDFRIYLHKDGKGEWAITGAVARKAAENSVISNFVRGGSVLAVKEALRYYSQDLNNIKRIWFQMMVLCFSLVQVLEMEYLRIGEIGLDIGLDGQGRLWFIEANNKPGKKCMELKQVFSDRVNTYPFYFAKYLAGY